MLRCTRAALKRRIAELAAEHTGRVGGACRHRLGRDRWFTAPEAVAYGVADEVIGDPAGAPESGTPA
jgi:ATP-dependent Clp protease protease subunit